VADRSEIQRERARSLRMTSGGASRRDEPGGRPDYMEPAIEVETSLEAADPEEVEIEVEQAVEPEPRPQPPPRRRRKPPPPLPPRRRRTLDPIGFL
jgi:hypothetical protein